MQNQRVLRLNEAVALHQPVSWEFQARYALKPNGQGVEMPAGTWLLELDSRKTWPDGEEEYLYRTPSGEILALGSPLAAHLYTEVTEPQAIASMNAFRSLDTILEEDFGASLVQTCRGLPPFALICCPLCFGTSFTTLDLASAWCDGCSAAFHVRPTAGDPGFVVDVTWERYNPLAARYVLPRTERLLSTLVLKDSGDPRDMHREHCTGECLAGPILLTDGSSGLRPGLHRCQVGTLYGWRSLYGRVPTPEDLRDGWSWDIDGAEWPASAALRVLPLTHSERRALGALRSEAHGAAGEIEEVLRVRSKSPAVLEAMLPDVQNLKEGERYLLHHWVTMTAGGPHARYEIALPVWYVVEAVVRNGYLDGWTVVRKDICPRCGEPVSAQDAAAREVGSGVWETPHSDCLETWTLTGWRLPMFDGETGETSGQAHQSGGRPRS